MEKEGLRRLLEQLMEELCTADASSSIIKLFRDVKGRVFCVSPVKWPVRAGAYPSFLSIK